MKMRNIFIAIALAGFTSSCYYDTRENLNPQLPSNDTTLACDTTDVTYIKDIQPILGSSCTGCHGNGNSTGVTLNSSANAKKNIDKIISTTSSGSMPKYSTKLSDCKINKFKAWKNQNYK